jgi:uncharacterized protein YndB with AHSA1/START domain
MSSPVQFDTFVIERTYPAPLARVYTALADPRLKQRWFAEGHSHDVEQFTMQFEAGGREYARYRLRPGTPFPGGVLESDGVFLDIVPDSRIVSAATMAMGGRRISAALHTFELSATPDGQTRLRFTHQAAFFEGADGPAMRKAGWEQLLEQLHWALVEAAGETE